VVGSNISRNIAEEISAEWFDDPEEPAQEKGTFFKG
jgi:hypothetical protein